MVHHQVQFVCEERQFCSRVRHSLTQNLAAAQALSDWFLWGGQRGKIANDNNMSAVYRLRTGLESCPPTMRGARVIGLALPVRGAFLSNGTLDVRYCQQQQNISRQ